MELRTYIPRSRVLLAPKSTCQWRLAGCRGRKDSGSVKLCVPNLLGPPMGEVVREALHRRHAMSQRQGSEFGKART